MVEVRIEVEVAVAVGVVGEAEDGVAECRNDESETWPSAGRKLGSGFSRRGGGV